jgi:hypothetical protein
MECRPLGCGAVQAVLERHFGETQILQPQRRKNSRARNVTSNYVLTRHPKHKQKFQWLSVRKRTIPTDRPSLVSKFSANFYGEMRAPTVVNLRFLDQSRHFSFQVASQLFS